MRPSNASLIRATRRADSTRRARRRTTVLARPMYLRTPRAFGLQHRTRVFAARLRERDKLGQDAFELSRNHQARPELRCSGTYARNRPCRRPGSHDEWTRRLPGGPLSVYRLGFLIDGSERTRPHTRRSPPREDSAAHPWVRRICKSRDRARLREFIQRPHRAGASRHLGRELSSPTGQAPPVTPT